MTPLVAALHEASGKNNNRFSLGLSRSLHEFRQNRVWQFGARIRGDLHYA